MITGNRAAPYSMREYQYAPIRARDNGVTMQTPALNAGMPQGALLTGGIIPPDNVFVVVETSPPGTIPKY
jgi:hypothetical protein